MTMQFEFSENFKEVEAQLIKTLDQFKHALQSLADDAAAQTLRVMENVPSQNPTENMKYKIKMIGEYRIYTGKVKEFQSHIEYLEENVRDLIDRLKIEKEVIPQNK